MALISRSPSTRPNARLVEKKPQKAEGNRAWLKRLGAPGGVVLEDNGIILLGGSSLTDFRIRVAQSVVRGDLFPSFWSHCGILLGDGLFAAVPLGPGHAAADGGRDEVSMVPRSNGVQMSRLDDFDDPRRFPNVAVVRFARRHPGVRDHIARLKGDRGVIDLPAMILPWLGHVWGVGGAANPLLDGIGLPAAAFVETVFSMAGFELTPGLSSTSSCPEAIWQSAKWWTEFYEGISGDAIAGAPYEAMCPEGFFAIRQPAAAILE